MEQTNRISELENLDQVTLRDTIDLMNSGDYKERFVAEYVQTKIRYNNLHKMLVKHEAKTLEFTPACPIATLQLQASYMGNYLKQLEVRAEIEKIHLPKNI